MSLFGAQFHPNKTQCTSAQKKIGDYAGLDNGTKITFQVPASLETGLYEAAVVNIWYNLYRIYVLKRCKNQQPLLLQQLEILHQALLLYIRTIQEI